MDPEEVQAIIAELEQQRSAMGARAAEYARANYRLQKENTELKKLLEKVKDAQEAQQAVNGEDRQAAERFNS
jgi:regulator of replication initiation timing